MSFGAQVSRKYLTLKERSAFLGAAKLSEPEIETFCLALAHTGARISELLALCPSRVDLAAQIVILECLKKRKRGVFRAVPVSSELLSRIDEVHALTLLQNEPIRCEIPIWPWSRTTAWTKVKRVMQIAHVPPPLAIPRALRHTFGVVGIMEANVPLNLMQRWLGHAKIETTAIYANAVGTEERAIAQRMWRS